MSRPTISAVIPVYDTAPLELDACLASLRATRIADEIILVDDRSDRRETRSALQQHAETGVRVLCSRAPHGTTAARCLGVHAARGDRVLSLDADDTIERRGPWQPDTLPPIALATSNVSDNPPRDIWRHIETTTPIQWGSLVRTDIARAIAGSFEDNREEDRRWAYCLMMEAWRSKLPIGLSGLHYTWRDSKGRDTVSSRLSQTKTERADRWRLHLDAAIKHIGICDHDAAAVRLWADRKAIEQPHVESHTKAGARVDVHVLSYAVPAWQLREALDSLADEPVNVHILVGGHHGSIGAARAHGFRLGSAEYVSFFDDDDLCEPGAIQTLVDALDAKPDAVGAYTDTAHLHADGHWDVEPKGRPWRPIRQLTYWPEITHAKVMRRRIVERYAERLVDWPTLEEYVLCAWLAKHGPWLHLPFIGCKKRWKDGAISSMRLMNRSLFRRALKEATPPLMRAHRRLERAA